jgi:glycosyltransferase involved in cell wall biosynthesis
MNILYICSEYPPCPTQGGIGTVTQILAEGMAKLGHKVHVAGIYSDITKNRQELVSDVVIHRLKHYTGVLKDSKARIKLFFYIKKLIKKERIDLIEAHDFMGPTAFWYGKLPPVVIRLHGSVTYFTRETNGTPSKQLFFFEKNALIRATALISVSNYVATFTRNVFNLHKKNIQNIYNAIQISSKPVFTGRDPQNVIFSGTLMRKKGVFTLIEAWNKVALQYGSAKLDIYGKDSLNENGESIQALLEKMLIPSIRHTATFHGRVDRNILLEKLSHAGIAVFPSFSEALAMAPLEAMATGCPTISSKLASGPEVIENGIDGLLIDPSNPDELSEAILSLLKDSKMASEIGKTGYQKVKTKFNIEEIILQNESFYKKITDKRLS